MKHGTGIQWTHIPGYQGRTNEHERDAGMSVYGLGPWAAPRKVGSDD